MDALTLWPEWAFAWRWLGKDVENRSWRPPARLIGQRLAIHAAVTPPTTMRLRAMCITAQEAHGEGHCYDTGPRKAPWVRWRWSLWRTRPVRTEPITLGAILGTAIVGEPTRESDSPWAMPGQWHWPLLEPQYFDEPVPAKGRQGLWSWEVCP